MRSWDEEGHCHTDEYQKDGRDDQTDKGRCSTEGEESFAD